MKSEEMNKLITGLREALLPPLQEVARREAQEQVQRIVHRFLTDEMRLQLSREIKSSVRQLVDVEVRLKG